ncbi:MAG: FMN-binding protein [bacterium]|nr:FMN-binding protein [bacterium]
MKSNFYTIAYAAILALVCATALTAVNALTKEDYENNKKAKKAREIMRVLDVSFDKNTPAKKIIEIQEEKVKKDIAKAELYGVEMVYFSDHPNEGRLWAITFEGEGMWKPIKGLLCLRSDMKTIHRLTFYEQEETPGLGAKIAKPKFQEKFRGKFIYDKSGKPGVLLKRPGSHSGNHEVDAITGATITSGKVQVMLNKLIEKIANAEKLPEVPDVR